VLLIRYLFVSYQVSVDKGNHKILTHNIVIAKTHVYKHSVRFRSAISL